MRDYELTLVLRADLPDKTQKKLLEMIKKSVEEAKGKVEKEDLWGKRALAYPISKVSEGIYTHLAFNLPEGETFRLEKKIKLEEGVLRHLLVKRD